MVFSKKNSTIVILTSILYFSFAYQLERTQFYELLFLYFGLFASFFWLIQSQKENTKLLTVLSIFFRLIFLFSIPNLSQDFYRFIWDGRLILEGLNPYLSLPESLMLQQPTVIKQAQELYAGMGSFNGGHFTNYPPLNQFAFLIAAVFANKSILGSVIVMRILIILADIGILYFGKKLLEKLKMPTYHIFFYLLNPLVIIELTGNLHFESVMIFFLIWSLYALLNQKIFTAAILIAFSISIKLIPFLLVPIFFQWVVIKKDSIKTNIKRFAIFYGVILATSILLFLPFYSSKLIENYTASIGLWFQNFEFNASIYYIFREIGYFFRGYNEIAIIGKITSILTILFVGYVAFFRKNNSPKQLITTLLFGLSFYYFTTTTVHPWYLVTLVALSVFTNYKFPIVWSLVIVLSYQTYANTPWRENLLLVSLEYLIVYGFLFYEIFQSTVTNKKKIIA